VIPRLLHYVWIGGRPLNALGERCLASWQRHLPGWEIRRWDETNSPMDNPYVRTMMERGLPAFASDLIRLHALWEHGGLYLDTDVELLRNPEDLFPRGDLVVGLLSLQNRLKKCSIGTSWIAAGPGHPLLRKIRDRYLGLRRAVMNNTIFTEELLPLFRGQEFPSHGNFEFFQGPGLRLYHPEFFSPVEQGEAGRIRPRAGSRSYALHHCAGNWGGQADRLPWWRRVLDSRIDRKILRPIEGLLRKARP